MVETDRERERVNGQYTPPHVYSIAASLFRIAIRETDMFQMKWRDAIHGVGWGEQCPLHRILVIIHILQLTVWMKLLGTGFLQIL